MSNNASSNQDVAIEPGQLVNIIPDTNNFHDHIYKGYQDLLTTLQNFYVGGPDLAADDSRIFWLQNAIEINSNNAVQNPEDPQGTANFFVRGVTRNGLLYEHPDRYNSGNIVQKVQTNSDIIGQYVLGTINGFPPGESFDATKQGVLFGIDDFIRNDIESALQKGDQSVADWGGDFYFWNTPLTKGDPSSTIGATILRNPAAFEEFVALNAKAAFDTLEALGQTGSPSDIINGLATIADANKAADAPTWVKNAIIDRILDVVINGDGWGGNPENIDGYRPIHDPNNTNDATNVTGWMSGTTHVTNPSLIQELNQRYMVRINDPASASWQAGPSWTTIGSSPHRQLLRASAVAAAGTGLDSGPFQTTNGIENQSVSVDVLLTASDPGNPSATLSIVANGPNAPAAVYGTVVVRDGKLVYTPNHDHVGRDFITYAVTDGRSTSASVAEVMLSGYAHTTVIANADGSTTTKTFDSSGLQASEQTANTDGSHTDTTFAVIGGSALASDKKIFDSHGTLTSEVTLNPDGTVFQTASFTTNADNSRVTRYTNDNGDLIQQKVVNADGTSTVSLYEITGKLYASTISSYGAGGALISEKFFNADGSVYQVETVTTGADGSTTADFVDGSNNLVRHEIGRADGTREVLQYRIAGEPYAGTDSFYSASGALSSKTLLNADGSIYLAGVVTANSDESSTINYGNGSGGPAISETDYTDGSSRIDIFGIAGQNYTSTQSTFDTNGTLTAETFFNSDGTRDVKVFAAVGGVSTETDSHYDSSGALVSATFLSNGFLYQSETAKTNSDGSRTYDYFDFRGVPSTENTVAADGTSEVTTYGISGQPYASTESFYDAAGNLTSETFVAADQSIYQSETIVRNADGSSATTFYDGAGTVISVEHDNADFTSEVLQYGITGKPYSSTDAFFDPLGRLTAESLFARDGSLYQQETVARNGDGSIASSQVTTYGVTGKPYTSLTAFYDANGNLTSDTYFKSDGSVYATDTVTSVTNPDGSTAVTHVSSDGTTTTYYFDANGNPIAGADPGPTLTGTAPARVGHGQTVVVGAATPGLAGDTLSLVVTTQPSDGSLSLTNGVVSYAAASSVPAGGASDTFTYQVKDQFGDLSAPVTTTLLVDPGPRAAAGMVMVGHDRSFDFTALVNALVTPGLPGDTETITAVTGNARLTGATITYAAPHTGADSFTYTATDQLGEAATGTVGVTVDPGPTPGTVASSLRLGQSLDLTSAILGAAHGGLPGDAVSIAADDATLTLGSIALVNGKLTYTASGAGLSHIPANGSVHDSFVYTIADQYGDTATGTAFVTVTNPATTINGPPYGSATIQGTSGTDIINAAGYSNTIYANGGNDVINAGSGSATVFTGTGDVVTHLAGYSDKVSGGDGNNTVAGSAGNATVTLGNGADSVTTGGYDNAITLGNGNDTVDAGQGQARIKLGDGNDAVKIAGYNNTIAAGNGNDSVTGGDGNGTFVLGNGNDTVKTAGYNNKITVGSGTDTIVAGDGQATVTAGAGTDTIKLAGYNNHVILNGSTATVSSDQGRETVVANGGHDTFSFAGWNDVATLDGAITATIMDLGHGLRINIGSSTQMDTISGFGADGHGLVDFQNGAGGFGSVADVMHALYDDGHGGTMLALGAAGSIDFVGTQLSQLHAAEFLIG